MSGILPMLIIVPLIGGVILLVADKQAASSKRAALVLAAVNLLLSVALIGSIFVRDQVATAPAAVAKDAAVATIDPAMTFAPDWLSVTFSNDLKLQMALGADGLAAGMVFLTALVAFGVIAFAQSSIQCQFSSYAGWVLLSQAGLLVVFVSMDILLFYLGFELALLPLLALISGWGDEDRAAVAKRFVLYTLAGSIPMVLALVGIVNLYSTGGQTILLEQLSQRASTAVGTDALQSQAWVFWLLVLGLGIKVAILPFHTWMPSTYRASAPTTTALLAAVVLKLGFFGFFRLALPLVPAAVQAYAPTLLGTLGAIAIVYGAIAALAQTDLRLILAYSSLSHAGFISLGMFSLSTEGLTGAALQMFNHGITTAGMFLLVAAIVARVGSTEVKSVENGLASYFPLLGVMFMFFTFAGAGMPGLNNFVGELLTLSGMMGRNPVLALVGVSGVILGAWYALRLARKLMFGAEESDKKHKRPHLSADLDAPQIASLGVLALLCILIGCLPQLAVNFVQKDVARIAAIYQPASTSETPATAVSSLETDSADVQIVANR